MTATKPIDSSQAYFWTEEWQEMERRADEDQKAGRSVTFKSAEEAVEFLRKRDRMHVGSLLRNVGVHDKTIKDA